jgi:hypothetical protein
MIYKGSLGDEIILDIGQSLVGATKIEMHVRTPTGSSQVWEATAHATPECITHTTQAGELVDEGVYVIQAYVEWGGLSKHPGRPLLVHYLDVSYAIAINDIRRAIQDKNPDRPLLSDEEIYDELIAAGGDTLAASLACAEALVARGAHKVSKKIGDRQINYSDLLGHYQALVALLEDKIRRLGLAYVKPPTGKVSGGKVADVDNYPIEFQHSDADIADWAENV